MLMWNRDFWVVDSRDLDWRGRWGRGFRPSCLALALGLAATAEGDPAVTPGNIDVDEAGNSRGAVWGLTRVSYASSPPPPVPSLSPLHPALAALALLVAAASPPRLQRNVSRAA